MVVVTVTINHDKKNYLLVGLLLIGYLEILQKIYYQGNQLTHGNLQEKLLQLKELRMKRLDMRLFILIVNIKLLFNFLNVLEN